MGVSSGRRGEIQSVAETEIRENSRDISVEERIENVVQRQGVRGGIMVLERNINDGIRGPIWLSDEDRLKGDPGVCIQIGDKITERNPTRLRISYGLGVGFDLGDGDPGFSVFAGLDDETGCWNGQIQSVRAKVVCEIIGRNPGARVQIGGRVDRCQTIEGRR